ncbi:MAG: 1-phosphofructokinase family hexose kinase [Flavobacteriaceae bacterium]|nr:1-phosphofructokinase family hexose kinase [Flavobacteriaceae bacterium]
MKIITLTINPALDKSAKVDGLIPDRKLKCHSIQYQPGGGGINISRILKRLEIETICTFTSGGDTGKYLTDLLIKETIQPDIIPVKTWTRENLSVVDTQSNLQYRFGMPGNELSETELDSIKQHLKEIVNREDILVLSGSLTAKMPLDYYAQLIKLFADINVKIVIDTAGSALKEALKEKVFLIKPNQKELAQLAGKEFLHNAEQEAFAMELVASKKAQYVVVSLGARGAFLACIDGVFYKRTPSVKVKSTIGAGDSMVAGLIYAIQNGFPPEKMLKFGVACGVATTMSEGTGLATKENIDCVLELMK